MSSCCQNNTNSCFGASREPLDCYGLDRARQGFQYWQRHFWNAVFWRLPLFFLSMSEMMIPGLFLPSITSWKAGLSPQEKAKQIQI